MSTLKWLVTLRLTFISSNDVMVQDFQHHAETKAIQGFDLLHQLSRMRHAKNVSDGEVDLIIRTLVDSVQTYEQVVEVISLNLE
jgi:hypothetical protein